jgi:hypothetical protein
LSVIVPVPVLEMLTPALETLLKTTVKVSSNSTRLSSMGVTVKVTTSPIVPAKVKVVDSATKSTPLDAEPETVETSTVNPPVTALSRVAVKTIVPFSEVET